LAPFLVVAFQAPDVAPNAARDEALRLADEILAQPEGAVPFEQRAQALAIRGLWRRALVTYVEGLRLKLDREHYSELLDLVQRQPTGAARESEVVVTAPSTIDADQHYAAGLRDYFDRHYANAERELEAAIAQDNQDARFYYFLGLARLAQGKPGADMDFEQGIRLEQQNRPGLAAVSAALERVQGQARRELNATREAPH
jgi:hypothetical protein